jgi:DHA1 family tetracycline resistance protein-like MFS transporter
VGVANIIAPTIFSVVFAAALSTFRNWRLPGAPFLLSAVLLLLAVGLGLKATGVESPSPA